MYARFSFSSFGVLFNMYSANDENVYAHDISSQ